MMKNFISDLLYAIVGRFKGGASRDAFGHRPGHVQTCIKPKMSPELKRKMDDIHHLTRIGPQAPRRAP